MENSSFGVGEEGEEEQEAEEKFEINEHFVCTLF